MVDPAVSPLEEMIVKEPEARPTLRCQPTLENLLFSSATAMKERPVHSRCSKSVDQAEEAVNLFWEVSSPGAVLGELAEMEKRDPTVRVMGAAVGQASLSLVGEVLRNYG
jgi:hypothetical protein